MTGFYILHIVLKCLLPTLNKFSQMLTLNTYLLIYWERISHVDFEKICKKDCVLIFTSSKKIVIIPCNGWEKHISTICLAMTRRDYLWKINNSAKRFMVHLKQKQTFYQKSWKASAWPITAFIKLITVIKISFQHNNFASWN